VEIEINGYTEVNGLLESYDLYRSTVNIAESSKKPTRRFGEVEQPEPS
jgi:hypothetical protein